MFPRAELVLKTRSLDVHVERDGAVESRHRAHAVVCHAEGEQFETFGDPDAASFWRSALKPFQALPFFEDGAAAAFGFGSEELALACASHGGMPEHVDHVRHMLGAVGLDEDALRCGPHPPYDRDTATAITCAGGRPGRLHNNCSGKHAAMLVLAAHRGWSLDGYWRPAHPVQRRIRERLAAWIAPAPDGLAWAIDGCGVPTPWLPLREMARAFARLGRRAAAGDPAPAAVVGAMTSHPQLTSAPGREPLRIMRATAGRLLVKEGAEGVLCVGAPGAGWGLALKIEDGTRRAVGPAAVATMAACGLLTDEESAGLEPLAAPSLVGTTGERVGGIRGVVGGGPDGPGER